MLNITAVVILELIFKFLIFFIDLNYALYGIQFQVMFWFMMR